MDFVTTDVGFYHYGIRRAGLLFVSPGISPGISEPNHGTGDRPCQKSVCCEVHFALRALQLEVEASCTEHPLRLIPLALAEGQVMLASEAASLAVGLGRIMAPGPPAGPGAAAGTRRPGCGWSLGI